MFLRYAEFIKNHVADVLLFALLMTLSVPGQTFFLSLFTSDIEAKYALTSGQLGGVFAFATFAGAVCLSVAGKLMDTVTLASMVLATGIALALGCGTLAMPWSSPLVLVLAVFCLRFTGQGLFLHIANTAAVKMFPQQAGKMLAVVGTLFSLISIGIPIALVALIAYLGWENNFATVGILIALGTVIAAAALQAKADKPQSAKADSPTEHAKQDRPSLAAMYRLCPVMIAFSFIFTGLLFHQSALAASKGWSLGWLAGCFSVFAFSKAASSLLFGEAIDRFGARAILPYFLLPVVIALAALLLLDSSYVAILYLGLFGISAAIDIKLGTILWKELYSAQHIGYVRSKFEAIRIIATGLAPLTVGWLLDMGVGMDTQILAFLFFTAVAVVYAFARTKQLA